MSLTYKFSVKDLIKREKITQQAVDQTKQLLAGTIPKLPEQMIALFLLSCENDTVLTTKTILEYFKQTTASPELFSDRDIHREDLRRKMGTVVCCSLPVRTPTNSVIHCFRLIDTNHRNFDLALGMKLAFMLVEVSQSHDPPPDDLTVVLDMKGIHFMHLTCLKLGLLKKFMEFVQEAMPLKIRAIFVVNANYMFDRLLALAKIFVKRELLEMVKTFTSSVCWETFHDEFIPAKCLPEEYGGDLPSLINLNVGMIERFEELRHFYEAQEELIKQYDENKCT